MNLSEEHSCEFMQELTTGNFGMKPGWVRLNFNYFIPESEFEFILKSLEWIATNGWKLLHQYSFDDTTGIWTAAHEADIKLSSLHDFLLTPSRNLIGSNWNKEWQRKKYFRFADALVKKADQMRPNAAFQSYHFPQLEKQLRWYALAQDTDTK
jgi:hypothetical protein